LRMMMFRGMLDLGQLQDPAVTKEMRDFMGEKKWDSDYQAAFFEWAESHSYSKKSISAYSSMFFKYARFLEGNGIKVTEASQVVIGIFIKSLTVSDKTKNIYLWLISDIYSRMVEEGDIEINPAEKLLSAKKKANRGRVAKRIPLALSEKETSLLLAFANTLPNNYSGLRRKCVLLVFLGCGLRAQELCDLGIIDIHLDDEEPWIFVTGKNQRQRVVPVPDAIVSALLDFRDIRNPKHKPFLCSMGTGNPYTPSGVYRLVREAMVAAGIMRPKMSPHILRHTFATSQLRNGTPLTTVKVWLGHDFISTTAKYEHVVLGRSGERPVV